MAVCVSTSSRCTTRTSSAPTQVAPTQPRLQQSLPYGVTNSHQPGWPPRFQPHGPVWHHERRHPVPQLPCPAFDYGCGIGNDGRSMRSATRWAWSHDAWRQRAANTSRATRLRRGADGRRSLDGRGAGRTSSSPEPWRAHNTASNPEDDWRGDRQREHPLMADADNLSGKLLARRAGRDPIHRTILGQIERNTTSRTSSRARRTANGIAGPEN